LPSRFESFEDRCHSVLNLKVGDCMSPPKSNEFVIESETLEEAIHKLAIGRHQSLRVTSGENIVGILRLCDVYQQLTQGSANPNPCKMYGDNLGN